MGSRMGIGGERPWHRMGVGSFCGGVLFACLWVNLGWAGASRPAHAAPPSHPSARAVAAAPASSVSPAPGGEGSPKAAVEEGGRGRRNAVRALWRGLRPLFTGPLFPWARRAVREPAAGTIDAGDALRFEIVVRAAAGKTSSVAASASAHPAETDADAVSRLSSALLRLTARYRHVATPTLVVDSDTGALLFGLTWRR